MSEICSCGARPPEDALFCHKCGRPLREIVAVEAPTPDPQFVPPPPPPPAAGQVAQLNFRNPVAMRIALLVSVVATLVHAMIIGQAGVGIPPFS